MRAGHFVFATLVFCALGAAPAAMAQTCDAYFEKSKALAPVVTEAYAAMSPANPKAMATALPKLEAEFNKLPATEIKAELCNGNHINAYTDHQFAELNALRAHGLATGFPADVPLVKQPDMNHAPLAYAVGWIKYEQGNFDGALVAYAKGLAMFPHNQDLQNEYLATLMQLKRFGDVVDFSGKILSENLVTTDKGLGKIYAARAVAQMALNQYKEADESFTASLNYDSNDETRSMQAELKTAMSNKN